MESISIHEIAEWCNGQLLEKSKVENIKSVSINSKKIGGNCLFIPLKGQNADGHSFVNDAFKNGAVASLWERKNKIPENTHCLVLVEDTLAALQEIAKNYRKKFNIPVIGVTGSVGKTTTKEMIYSVLSAEMDVLKTEGNYNGQIGMPLSLLNMESHHEAAVIEMGISEFGEMDRLAEIARPSMGVITNIGISHIENLKTRENIREEKLKILKNYEGRYFLNGDNPLLADLDSDKFKDIVYFGLNGAYQYRAEDISSDGKSTEFVLVAPDFKENVSIPCLGIHNVYNALAAISVALSMGMYFDDIKRGLLNFEGVKMRQQILNIDGVNIIDDSYNASPDSVKSSISVLRAMRSEGRNIVVMSDMLELGEDSKKIHYDLGKYIAVEGIDILVTTGELAKFIHDGASDAALPIKTIHCENNDQAAERVYNLLKKGDKVLIKGSRGRHTDEIAEHLKQKIGAQNEQ